MPFLQSRDPRQVLRSILCSRLTPLAQAYQCLVHRSRQRFQFFASLLQSGQFRLRRSDQRFLFGALGNQPLEFVTADVQPLAYASHLRIELLQHVTRSHRLGFSVSLFGFEAVKS